MKNYLLVFSFFSTFFINAQELEAQSSVGTVTSMQDIFTKHLKNSTEQEVSGSPFLFSSWNNSGVLYYEGNSYALKKLNYNILSDDIGTLKGVDSVLTYEKVKIDSFSVSKKMFKKYLDSFYEVLSDGSKTSLLKKYEVSIIDGMFNPIDGTKEKSRFKITDDYYKIINNDIVKFYPSKKSVLNSFKEYDIEMNKYIKQNKLSFKKEKDLIQIFDFYNQL